MYSTDKISTTLQANKHEKFDNGILAGAFYDNVSSTFHELRAGTKVEDFRSKIQKHENASSDFETEFYSPARFDGIYTMGYVINGLPNRPFVETFNGVLDPLDVINHIVSYTDENRARALAKLYNRLRSERTSFEGLTFLGELHDTVRLLRSPASALRQGFDKHFKLLESRKLKIMKMPWSKRRRAWEDVITGTYLEGMFGWLPVISDIRGILQLLEDLEKRKFPATRITSRSSFTSNDVVTDSSPNYIHPASEWYLTHQGKTTTRSSELKVQYSVGIDITQGLNKSALKRSLDLSGFRLDEFIPSLYAVTPFSWMIDYLSSLGDFISSVTYDKSQVKWVNETLSFRTLGIQFRIPTGFSVMSTQLSAANRTLGYIEGDLGHSSLVRTTVIRKTLTDIPSVPIVVTINGLNVKKMLNIAAVVAQMRGHSDLRWLSKRA